MSDQVTFPPPVVTAMRAQLPAVAEQTVASIVVEVPSYAGAFSGEMGRAISNAVQLALGGFLELATTAGGADASRPIGPALEGAYSLGRGEARSGRSMDALLAAYRVGARVSWRHMSDTAVGAGLSVGSLARFAELVFAYIDQLSAASVAGHTDELETTGRVRRHHRERLGALLLAGRPLHDLTPAAERAGWPPPRTLTAVLLPEVRARGAVALLDSRTLQLDDDPPGLDPALELSVLLVPDAGDGARTALLRALEGRTAVVGPARPWSAVAGSYARALRALRLGLRATGSAPLDTEQRLPELVLRADEDALADLRAAALAPLDGLTPATREKLAETLRSWLLHHGRREQVAAELFVHPQTVRYRMGQLRDLYGDRLEDPQTVLQLTIALGAGEALGAGGT
ncbi:MULTISPECIES: PucR family transcriptional regulator [unclassified Modestobacter]|uniref:PucR family transcriptional regulator n=1 Tax=unclassified Modestobacter TaxID=2643866 RepID=UPI0022AAD6B7|nr:MULTISPECIES: helix-turn-helix domain-containing protein [unclassified Modestobacter]MCZ2826341.1 helix-turn-helix domain-containing protein [Modestobacter sp. VKM Ac-2981]MCZ2852594.1 helix-turn-helix domain-containing protein [Modestobacter sp. VKM Ac-2982]